MKFDLFFRGKFVKKFPKFTLAYKALGQFICYVLFVFTFFTGHHFFRLFLLFCNRHRVSLLFGSFFRSFPSFRMIFFDSVHSLSNQGSCEFLSDLVFVHLILHFLALSIKRDFNDAPILSADRQLFCKSSWSFWKFSSDLRPSQKA